MAAYKGIPYRIEKIGPEQWRWSIQPTTSVIGLKAMDGISSGPLTTAIGLVKIKIDRQLTALMEPELLPYREGP